MQYNTLHIVLLLFLLLLLVVVVVLVVLVVVVLLLLLVGLVASLRAHGIKPITSNNMSRQLPSQHDNVASRFACI